MTFLAENSVKMMEFGLPILFLNQPWEQGRFNGGFIKGWF